MSTKDEVRIGRWYFGGLASAGAASCTHPLDLLKVHLQTASAASNKNAHKPPTLISTTVNIVKRQGVLALYNGLSASLLRQLTYSTTRFGIYETAKKQIQAKSSKNGAPQNIPFYQKILLAAGSGAVGGFIGAPADMINVRMQNDIKLPNDVRRNYKHAFDGLFKVYKTEGTKNLFNGASMATVRAMMITMGQLSMYDQFKYLLITYYPTIFKDNLLTHFVGSFMAGMVATTITQPLDVMKTRLMSANPGQYNSILSCAKQIFVQMGPLGFFRGYVPAFVRLGPQTVITFVFFEQLRLRFGYLQT